MDRVYNFAAGPSMLPIEVLEKIQKDLLNYNNSGMSVMEMSHRSEVYKDIFDHAKRQFIKVMNVPDNYEVLFLSGGATSQFSMVPLNLKKDNQKASYAITGNFSKKAYLEAKKFINVDIAYDGSSNGFTRIPTQEELNIDPNSTYFHYCANNTVYGTEWKYVPDTDVDIICDMSSNIASKPIDISKYALIYAGAQKNIAPAGVTIVIIRKDLLTNVDKNIPVMYDYKIQSDNDSMYNTPPCFQIYVIGLVMDYIELNGGLEKLEIINKEKANILYKTIDESKLFKCHANKDSRSNMNVTFKTISEELDKKFIVEAEKNGLINLKGHKALGGLRASIYNAMPIDGVKKLADFIKDFDKENS